MAFETTPTSKPSGGRPSKNSRRPKGPVFCVGWHAFVNWPSSATNGVPALDRAGASFTNDLVDGDKVEILSWQPRSSHGLIYEIRRVADRTECWLSAAQLRATGTPPAATPTKDR